MTQHNEAERLAKQWGVTGKNMDISEIMQRGDEMAALLRSQAVEIERLKGHIRHIGNDALRSELHRKDELLRGALASLDESRDDVAACLAEAEQFAGYERYDRRIAFYKEQLAKHDAVTNNIKTELGEQT